MAATLPLFYQDPWDNELSWVTSRELSYRLQRDAIKEAGKAIVAFPGAMPQRTTNDRARQKTTSMLLAPELPKYSIQVYQKMFQRLGLARSIIQRMVELILSPEQDIRPPDSILKSNAAISDDLKNNIAFVRKWQRYKGFKTWSKEALECAFWAGNSYSEIVIEKETEERTPGRPPISAGWKIHELKLIPPDEMRPIRDSFGEVLGYVQYPFKGTYSWLTQEQSDAYVEHGAVIFQPHEILHIQIDTEPGEAYGTSKLEAVKDILAIVVGMREDIGMIVKNYAAPTILFRIGTELIPASASTVTDFKNTIESQMTVSSNIVTSTMVTADVIDTAKAVMNMEGYMRMMMGILFGSMGVPEIMLGQGNDTTEATGKQQVEAAGKQVRVVHQMLKDKVELQVFSYLCVKKYYHQLTPTDLDKIPELWYGPIETEEDKRLRTENQFRYGMITRQEARKRYGMSPNPEGDLTPEADLKFQKAIIKYTAQMAKEFAPPMMGATGAPAKSTKGKPTSKKSDRDAEHGKKGASSTKKS